MGSTLLDETTLKALQSEQRLLRTVGAWLGSYRWQLYLVVTFSRPPQPARVRHVIEQWVDDFHQEYPTAFVYPSADRGAERGRWNVHLLVGGLFSGKPPQEPHKTIALTRALAVGQRLWWHGQVLTARPYEARRGAVTYIARDWNEPELPAQIYGTPITRSHARRERR